MNENKHIVRATFDSSAEQFDEIGTPFFRHFGKILADEAGIKPDDIILDVACGKGAVTFPASEKLTGKGEMYAFDLSPEMVSCCRKNDPEGRICFSVMDAENMEYEDEKFDKVFCGFGLFFLPDIEKGLQEIKRVLKTGGTLVFSSWNKQFQLPWLYEILSAHLPSVNKKASARNISDEDFRTVEGIDKILEIAGFTKLNVMTEYLDCFYRNEEEWILSRWNSGTRMYFEKLDDTRFSQVKNEIVKRLGDYKQNGKIKIPMSAFITKAYKP